MIFFSFEWIILVKDVLVLIYDFSLRPVYLAGSYDKKLLAAPHPMLLLNLLDLLIVLSLSFLSSVIAVWIFPSSPVFFPSDIFYAEIDNDPLAVLIVPGSILEVAFFKSMLLPKLAILLCFESLFKKYLLKDPFSYNIFRFYWAFNFSFKPLLF